MEQRTELNIQYLHFGAKMGKQVEIMYKYLDAGEFKQRRYGSIQPIKWLYGRKGVHILAWDTEADNWRRFAISHIERVVITDIDWTNKELQETLTATP